MSSPDGSDARAVPAPDAACAACAPLLPLLGHASLSSAAEAEARAHLAACARCQTLSAAYDQLDTGLRAYSAALEAEAPDPESIVQAAYFLTAAELGDGTSVAAPTPGRREREIRDDLDLPGLGPGGITEKGLARMGMETDLEWPAAYGAGHAYDEEDTYEPPAIGHQRTSGLARASRSRPLTVPRLSSRHPRTLPAVAAALLLIALGGALFALLASQRHPQAHGTGHTTLGGQPAACAPSQITVPSLHAANISQIAMASPDEGWAVGSLSIPEQTVTGLILRYSHCRWLAEGPELPGIVLDSLSVVAVGDAWASGSDLSGEHDILLHYTAGSWHQLSVPGLDPNAVGFSGITMLSADEGWLSAIAKQPGQARKFWTGGFLYHYQHGTWTRVACPPVSCEPQVCPQGCGPVFPVAPDEFWMIPYGANDQTQLVHYRAGTWTSVRVPGPVTSLRFNSPTDGWGIGSAGYDPRHPDAPLRNFAVHYDGTSWTRTTLLDDSRVNDTPYVTVFGPDTGWAFVSSTGHSPFRVQPNFQDEAYHLSGGHWQPVPWPFTDITFLQVVAPLTDGECWAVAAYHDNGGAHPTTGNVLLHYANGAWTAYGR